MTRMHEHKTTFTAGELSPELLGRGDLAAYQNGALALRNVFISPTGGVKRRAGLGFIDIAEGDGKLIAFEFNTEQTYLLVLTDEEINIYADGVLDETIAAPWTLDQIRQLAWTQSADTAVTVTPSGTTGSITLTASAAVFEAGHDETRLRVGGKEVRITAVATATSVTVTVIETLAGTGATLDWEEQAFSPVRGYPVTSAFHQDRLVIGGSRDLPNRLWFSRSGDLMNFNPGTGLDDEAIEFAILSDQVNAIRGIFSGRHLQVFTSGAEWMVSGDPLTPAEVQIRRQTRIGSIIERYIPPVNVDGATMFIARSGRGIQELLYTDIQQAYRSTDIALLARHMIVNLVDQDYDQKNRLIYVLRGDGQFATYTALRSENVGGWTLHTTEGLMKSIAVVGDEVYVLVNREGVYTIEQFDETIHLDSALTGTAETPADTWSGLGHLEGLEVSIVADGFIQPDETVTGGEITLEDEVSEVVIGLPYAHIIEPLPPSELGIAGSRLKLRLVQAIFRLQETAALKLDVGRGLKDISLLRIGEEENPDEPPPLVSGDIKVRALCWQSARTRGLWRIEQSAPLPFTLLSVNAEIKVND